MERFKQIPKYQPKSACKYGGECTDLEKSRLAIMAVLDVRGGRERFINKTKTPKITISDFAVLTCCEKMVKILKAIKKKLRNSRSLLLTMP